jgi:hypothetical protein
VSIAFAKSPPTRLCVSGRRVRLLLLIALAVVSLWELRSTIQAVVIAALSLDWFYHVRKEIDLILTLVFFMAVGGITGLALIVWLDWDPPTGEESDRHSDAFRSSRNT